MFAPSLLSLWQVAQTSLKSSRPDLASPLPVASSVRTLAICASFSSELLVSRPQCFWRRAAQVVSFRFCIARRLAMVICSFFRSFVSTAWRSSRAQVVRLARAVWAAARALVGRVE